MRAGRTPAIALLVALAACSTGTEPSADLGGEWDYTFATLAPVEACPNAPPGFRAGCGGAGRLTLTQDADRIGGTLSLSGSCQSCSTVADYRDSRRPVTGRWLGDDEIELSIQDCGHPGGGAGRNAGRGVRHRHLHVRRDPEPRRLDDVALALSSRPAPPDATAP